MYRKTIDFSFCLAVFKKKDQQKEIFRYNRNKKEMYSDTLHTQIEVSNGQK